MDTFAESGESDPKRDPDPGTEPTGIDAPARWVHALNSFLEHAFLEADRDTGC